MPVSQKTEASGPLLDVNGLTLSYGRATVVHSVSMQVYPGQFAILLGRNGAGKSTILHAISGLIPKKGGSVSFLGKDITTDSPRDIVRSGLVQVLERHRVFTNLTIEDNLLIGTYVHAKGGDRSKLERIYSLFPELASRRNELAARLSGGQQEILAVAQGVISEPKLFLLDEPSGGLAPIVVDRILEVAADLCKKGTAVLLVEQLVDKAMRYADHCYLLSTGSLMGQGSPSEIRNSDVLRRCYLGA